MCANRFLVSTAAASPLGLLSNSPGPALLAPQLSSSAKGVICIYASMPFSYELVKYQAPKYNYTWIKNNSTRILKPLNINLYDKLRRSLFGPPVDLYAVSRTGGLPCSLAFIAVWWRFCWLHACMLPACMLPACLHVRAACLPACLPACPCQVKLEGSLPQRSADRTVAALAS
jgi:hypothetical protein